MWMLHEIQIWESMDTFIGIWLHHSFTYKLWVLLSYRGTVSCAVATVWSAMLWIFIIWPLKENVCWALAWRNCGNLISPVNDCFENEHKTLILGNGESEVWWGFWERFLGFYRKHRREDSFFFLHCCYSWVRGLVLWQPSCGLESESSWGPDRNWFLLHTDA